jgi:thymidylate synthase (FAD)
MSAEEYMIYCARVSSPDNRLNHETAPKLLKYLLDAGHWSPFEMISIGFEIETSRAIAQQILRHRSFSFQEFSQRYSKVEAMEPVELRMQAEKNRQSSVDVLEENNILYSLVEQHAKDTQKLYNTLLEDGVAKECARMVLPLATQTTIVMHGTLRSWIHFLNQRCDLHAQKEIQLIAFEIQGQLSKVCPWTAKALNWSELDGEREYS